MSDTKADTKQAPTPICALCHKPNVTEGSHCFGCGELICDECDRSPPMGKHSKEDHLFDFSRPLRGGGFARWDR